MGSGRHPGSVVMEWLWDQEDKLQIKNKAEKAGVPAFSAFC
ncbi:hypothetical protein GYMC10_5608 [Paenibacillus sp. Y412MC10]|nr:hypothetical protein GYMC10_5608 [Paenibacillus sp. Y412MC10]ETT61414.1 hypothetical protein C172_19448 [Paenibacillus sp. FSL H8-457]